MASLIDNIRIKKWLLGIFVGPPVFGLFFVNLILVSLWAVTVGLPVMTYHSIMRKRRIVNRKKLRIVLVTDTSQQNICGVLRKFHELQSKLRERGHVVSTIHTNQFISFTLPRYSEVSLAVPSPYMMYTISRSIAAFDADIVNVMTEGNAGLAVRILCSLYGQPYSTMWCTRLDLYVREFVGRFWAALSIYYLRWFHKSSVVVITPSPSMGKELVNQGIVSQDLCRPILNGCNTEEFSSEGSLCDDMKDLPRPIWLYVGRVSHEKNISAFLSLLDKLPGSAAIVGKGPFFDEAVEKYASPRCKFLGWRQGEDLHSTYRTADVFVFPSRTDTFGQVIIEAMASGLPVAAYPVTGPIDLVVPGTGATDSSLLDACLRAHKEGNKDQCIAHAKTFDWQTMAGRFLDVHVEQLSERWDNRALDSK